MQEFRDRLGEFALTTSCHGLGPLHRSKSFALRIVWIIAIFTTSILLVVQIQQLCCQYVSYPTVTRIEIQKTKSEFPSLTLCNENPYRLEQVLFKNETIGESLKLREAVMKLYDYQETQEALLGVEKSKQIFSSDKIFSKKFEDFDQGDVNNPENQLRKNVILEGMKLTESERKDIGHQAIDMIQLCNFQNKECSYRDFSLFVSYEYGNCWTVNPSKGENSETLSVFQALVNIEARDYTPVISGASGAILFLHSQGSYPFTKRGIRIPNNYKAELGISIQKQERLPAPYGMCETMNERNNPKICETVCVQKRVQEKCGCHWHDYFDIGKFIPEPALRACRYDDDIICSMNVRREYAAGKLECSCPPPCQETEYSTTTLLTELSTRYQEANVKDKICLRERELNKTNERFTKICQELNDNTFAKNFLAVEIYLKNSYPQVFVQEPFYTFSRFMAEIGGSLVIYAGFSLLTGVEFLTFFVTMIITMIRGNKDDEADKASSGDGKKETANNNGTNV